MTLFMAKMLLSQSIVLHKEAIRHGLEEWAAAYWRRVLSLEKTIALIERRENLRPQPLS